MAPVTHLAHSAIPLGATLPKFTPQVRVVSVPSSPYASSNASVSTLHLDQWDGQSSRSIAFAPAPVGAGGSRFVEHLDDPSEFQPAPPAAKAKSQKTLMARAQSTVLAWFHAVKTSFSQVLQSLRTGFNASVAFARKLLS